MKKYIFIIAALIAVLAIGGGTAAAQSTSEVTPVLTLAVSPNVAAPNSTVSLHGNLSFDGVAIQNGPVSLRKYDMPGCEGDHAYLGTVWTDTHGNYSMPYKVVDPLGMVWFKARWAGTYSDCVQLRVARQGTAVSSDSLIALCFGSQTGGDPDWFPSAKAVSLVANQNYWEPYAVAGNVLPNGNNIGAYHLECNPNRVPTGGYVGDGGTEYGDDTASNTLAGENLGFYKKAA